MKHPILGLLEELMSGKPKEDWRNAKLIKTELAGERVIKDGIEIGRDYFVNMADIKDAEHSSLATGRKFGTIKTVAVYVQERERTEQMPLELLSIGSPVNKYECGICDWTFFDWRDEATLKEDRAGLGPNGEELGVTCSKCYEIIKPMAQSRDVHRIARQHREHLKECAYCQLDIPCVDAKTIRDRLDLVHLGDGYTGAQVMRRLISERVGPIMYKRKMRERMWT